jgi:hypothetical protein
MLGGELAAQAIRLEAAPSDNAKRRPFLEADLIGGAVLVVELCRGQNMLGQF